MLEAWKMTFIVMLSKRQDALKLSHFGPISLCIILYKICMKIMVGKFKLVLPRLISPK